MRTFEDGWDLARAQAVRVLEEEARGYEAQYGASGRGGLTAAVYADAARIVNEGLTRAPAPSPTS